MFREIARLLGRAPENDNPLRQYPPDDVRPILLVTLLAADDSVRQRSLSRYAGRRGNRAVFVTTDTDLTSFWRAGCPTEYLPHPGEVVSRAGTGNWEDYLAERWRLICTKWTPVWIVTEGLKFSEYLQKCGLHDNVRSSKY